MVAGDVEVEAGAVKGGVDGVEEPNDREEEDDVGQGVAREEVPRENRDGLPCVLDGEPRGRLRREKRQRGQQGGR